MADVFKKNKAEDFVNYCIKEGLGYKEGIIKQLSEKVSLQFWVTNSFNRSNATISFDFGFYEKDKKNKWNYKRGIGIQLERGQFRVYISLRGKKTDEIWEYGSEIKWFEENYDKASKNYIREHASVMKDKYCQYSGYWVYQYFNFYGKEEEYPVLLELIKKELNKAYKLIENKRFC